jgi:GTP-binding protein YchF
MKIGMIGLPQTGKKTLFRLLTGQEISEHDAASNKPIKGTAEIRDGRFDFLAGIYKRKKEVRARVDMEVLPRLEKDSIKKGDVFNDIADADALCHVVRAFKDDAIYHVDGSVDPKRDIGFVNSELMLNDLVFIEKRLERLDKGAKKGAEETAVKDKELLERLKSHLERELPLRLADLTPDDRKTISSYPFLTRKGMIIALNVSEDLVKDSTLLKHLEADYEKSKIQVMQVSAKVEAEIAALESEEERREFLKTIGVEEPAINALTRACIKALDLVSFFTVGPDEIRQWTIRRGSSAPEAAGAIHSDLQRGFIRAEVMKFADLSSLGSEEKVKEAGKLYIKGKDYIVEDGDILTIRFNV